MFVEIFDWCRMIDEHGWMVQATVSLSDITLQWVSNLKLHSLCNHSKPVTIIPSHFSSLPLLVSYDLALLAPPRIKQDLLLALQHPDRVRAISVIGVMEVRSYSRHSTRPYSPSSPCSPPSEYATNRSLLSLRLESIPASGYFPPKYLVECIACMPHLENMSISFYHLIFLFLRHGDRVAGCLTGPNQYFFFPRLPIYAFFGWAPLNIV
jgi:hypothetical protein